MNDESDYVQEKCLHELFEVQAARRPDSIALSFEGRQLSYSDLNTRANRLAWELIGNGGIPGQGSTARRQLPENVSVILCAFRAQSPIFAIS